MHIFRPLMLEFFAASGDFTRRLTSIKANSKFSNPNAGPEDYFLVRPEHPVALTLCSTHAFVDALTDIGMCLRGPCLGGSRAAEPVLHTAMCPCYCACPCV